MEAIDPTALAGALDVVARKGDEIDARDDIAAQEVGTYRALFSELADNAQVFDSVRRSISDTEHWRVEEMHFQQMYSLVHDYNERVKDSRLSSTQLFCPSTTVLRHLRQDYHRNSYSQGIIPFPRYLLRLLKRPQRPWPSHASAAEPTNSENALKVLPQVYVRRRATKPQTLGRLPAGLEVALLPETALRAHGDAPSDIPQEVTTQIHKCCHLLGGDLDRA